MASLSENAAHCLRLLTSRSFAHLVSVRSVLAPCPDRLDPARTPIQLLMFASWASLAALGSLFACSSRPGSPLFAYTQKAPKLVRWRRGFSLKAQLSLTTKLSSGLLALDPFQALVASVPSLRCHGSSVPPSSLFAWAPSASVARCALFVPASLTGGCSRLEGRRSVRGEAGHLCQHSRARTTPPADAEPQNLQGLPSWKSLREGGRKWRPSSPVSGSLHSKTRVQEG